MTENTLQLQTPSAPLTESEQVKACCIIAGEQLEKGNYDAGCGALRRWWELGAWPKHHGLATDAAAWPVDRPA